jgi:hypothetical protein
MAGKTTEQPNESDLTLDKMLKVASKPDVEWSYEATTKYSHSIQTYLGAIDGIGVEIRRTEGNFDGVTFELAITNAAHRHIELRRLRANSRSREGQNDTKTFSRLEELFDRAGTSYKSQQEGKRQETFRRFKDMARGE